LRLSRRSVASTSPSDQIVAHDTIRNDFDKAFDALWSAIKADDAGEVEGSLITLDLEDGMSTAPSDRAQLEFARLFRAAVTDSALDGASLSIRCA
jgi:hypothetical protein